jgi:hypothetical protein
MRTQFSVNSMAVNKLKLLFRFFKIFFTLDRCTNEPIQRKPHGRRQGGDSGVGGRDNIGDNRMVKNRKLPL